MFATTSTIDTATFRYVTKLRVRDWLCLCNVPAMGLYSTYIDPPSTLRDNGVK